MLWLSDVEKKGLFLSPLRQLILLKFLVGNNELSFLFYQLITAGEDKLLMCKYSKFYQKRKCK